MVDAAMSRSVRLDAAVIGPTIGLLRSCRPGLLMAPCGLGRSPLLGRLPWLRLLMGLALRRSALLPPRFLVLRIGRSDHPQHQAQNCDTDHASSFHCLRSFQGVG